MRRRDSAFTLLELMVAISSAVTLFLVTFYLLQSSVTSYRKVSGDQNASSQLLKAEADIRRELFATSAGTIDSGPGPITLTGMDSDSLWFLSANDPVTEKFQRDDEGAPMWQRNVLYYAVVPNGLDVDFSGAGLDVGGYEASYPYKLLIRKVIDSGAATTPADPTTEETLLADISSYLERPNGYELSSGDYESYKVVARDLLGFRAAVDPTTGRVTVTLQSANVEEARKLFPIGTRSLLDPPHITERRFEVYPENRNNLIPGS